MRKVKYYVILSFSYNIEDYSILKLAFPYGIEQYSTKRVFHFEFIGTTPDTSIRIIRL